MEHIENQFFTWTRWDFQDTASFTFYDCTLVRDIKNYKKGEKIPIINFMLDNSTMEFFDSKGNLLETFKLKLEVI